MPSAAALARLRLYAANRSASSPSRVVLLWSFGVICAGLLGLPSSVVAQQGPTFEFREWNGPSEPIGSGTLLRPFGNVDPADLLHPAAPELEDDECARARHSLQQAIATSYTHSVGGYSSSDVRKFDCNVAKIVAGAYTDYKSNSELREERRRAADDAKAKAVNDAAAKVAANSSKLSAQQLSAIAGQFQEIASQALQAGDFETNLAASAAASKAQQLSNLAKVPGSNPASRIGTGVQLTENHAKAGGVDGKTLPHAPHLTPGQQDVRSDSQGAAGAKLGRDQDPFPNGQFPEVTFPSEPSGLGQRLGNLAESGAGVITDFHSDPANIYGGVDPIGVGLGHMEDIYGGNMVYESLVPIVENAGRGIIAEFNYGLNAAKVGDTAPTSAPALPRPSEQVRAILPRDTATGSTNLLGIGVAGAPGSVAGLLPKPASATVPIQPAVPQSPSAAAADLLRPLTPTHAEAQPNPKRENPADLLAPGRSRKSERPSDLLAPAKAAKRSNPADLLPRP